MRVIRFDDGTRFDDPNAIFGNPSVMREPGDPGFILPAPDPQAPSSTQTKRTTMSSNRTPESRTILVALATRIHAGQDTHGPSIGLHHHTAAIMDAAIKKLTGDPTASAGSNANKGSQLVYRDCVDATADAEAALRTYSDGTVKTWLDGYRKVMEGIHGRKASDGWTAAGFPAGSTAVPRNHGQRLVLLTAARAYLAAHSSYEVTLPQPGGTTLAITAAQALTLQTALQAAMTLIDTRQAEQALCKQARDADVEALYDEVSGTIGEIGDRLDDDDARWELFGLNIPANPNPPLGVTSLTLTPAGTGRELAQWPYAVRAEYYRLFLKREGIDADFVNIADPKDLEYTIKNLNPGDIIHAYVVPMNDGGAGPASPTITKVVPA